MLYSMTNSKNKYESVKVKKKFQKSKYKFVCCYIPIDRNQNKITSFGCPYKFHRKFDVKLHAKQQIYDYFKDIN